MDNQFETRFLSDDGMVDLMFQALFERSVDAMLLLKDSCFINCNEAAAQMMGCTREELLYHHPSEFSPEFQPDGRRSLEKADEMIRLAFEKNSLKFEWVHRRLNGEEFDSEVNLTAVPWANEQALVVSWRDITPYRRNGRMPSEEEISYHSLFDSYQDGVFVIQDQIIQLVNPATANMLGYSQEELTGMPFTKVVAPEDLPIAAANYRNRIEGKPAPNEYSLRILHSDGKTRLTMLLRVSAIQFKGRVAVMGTLHNITEQMMMEVELRENRERLRTVINSNPMVLFALDRNGIFTLSEGQGLAELGLQPGQVVGLSVFDVYRGEPALLEDIGRALAGEAFQSTVQVGPMYFETTYSPLKNEQGESTGVIGISTNVTARRRADAERERLIGIVEATNDLVAVANMQGQLLYVNKAGRNMLGIMPDQKVEDFAIANCHPPEAAEMVATVGIPQAIEKGLWTGENVIISQDGKETLVLQTIMTHRSQDGTVEHVSTIARDISERKRQEQQQQEVLLRRGKQLQLGTEVAQDIASAPALDELFRRVVTLVKERFGYYHTQLLRYDPGLNAVVLVTGYGEIGARMLEAGHRMEMGRGLIGLAAASGQTVMRVNTRNDPDWKPNPLLPETRDEIALPIKFGDRVLGVLDVQSSEAGAITEDDQQLLEGLCGQIAIAIEGTTLRQQMEERLEELNAMYRATSREGWKDFQDTVGLPEGFVYNRSEVQPISDVWVDGIEPAVQENRLVIPQEREDGAAVAPLAVRGEVIGVMGIYEDAERPLTTDELSLIEQVSDQVALALENARLFEQTRVALGETEDQAQKLAALNEMSAALNRAGDAQEAMSIAVQNTLNIMGANRASVAIVDPSGEFFEVYAVTGHKALMPQGHRLPVAGTAVGASIRQNRVLILPLEAPLEGFIDSRTLADQGISMTISAPLFAGNRVMGTLNVATTRAGQYSARDGNLMAQLAAALASTIENRRLFEQIQRTLVETETLYNFSRQLSEARDLSEILSSVAEAMRIPVINRATLVEMEFDVQGGLSMAEVKAYWYSGKGVQPNWENRRYDAGESMQLFGSLLTNEPQFVAENPAASEDQPVFWMAALPLWIGSRQIGAILLQTGEPYHFSDEDKRPAASLAQQASIAVESRILFEETLASEARFRSTSEQLSQALSIARMGYFEFDPARQEFYVNDQILAVLDRTAEEVGGYTLSTQRYGELFLFPEEADLIPNALADAVKQQPNGKQVSLAIESSFRKRDNSRGYLATRIQGEINAQGQLERLSGAAQDITERKSAEQMLESQRRTLQAVLDNMPAGVFMVEAPSGRAMLSNRRAEEFLGRGISPTATGDELSEVYQAYRLGTDELYPADEMPVVAGMLGHAKMIDDMEVRRPDGTRALLQVNGSPVMDATGKVVASVVVFQDITEARRAQETIAKRAAELATVAEVSTAVSTIQNPDEMLQTVVDLTKQAFDLYHTHIYLVNESGDTLVLARGAGEVGRRMVSEGRRIALNAEQSLVARAARMRQGVIVNDVRQEPGFLPHPLLPHTSSEMAVPMIVGGMVLGVIDIQDVKVGRFTPEDVNIMTTLATQIAVSLQNARSYARAQRQAEREALINAISERIQATDSIESALQVAVREIGRALGAQHTVIRLGLERKDDSK